MDCEYHILGTLAYVKVMTFFKLKKPSHLVITHYKIVFVILLRAQIQKIFPFSSSYFFLYL